MAPSSRRIDPVMEMMDDGGADGGAPDTALRYQKARLKMLAKQLEDSVSLRQQLTEAVNDLQKQLHSEREENKKSRKRIQLLESDAKRNSGRRTAEAVGVDTVDSLSQEVANLRKDVQTAERIAKQSETIAKAKETHLKRALETIARLKTQVSEFQGQTQDSNQGERGKLDAVEARVKLLERQRADLIAAFKKQMKLIDVLKRQKVHLESSRLLHFTEDEFVRTLDWGV
jgi:chromosome segregation ATPase